MKLVATILAGPDLSNLPRAIASVVDHVDQVLLIDTVPLPEATTSSSVERTKILIEAYRVQLALGSVLPVHVPKILFRAWPWQRFDAARNEALALATEAGGNWAITLDADEWWTGAEQIRTWCTRAENMSQPIEALELPSGEGDTYYQPRVLRLPCASRWQGRVHEAIELKSTIKIVGENVPSFHSDPKTPEQVHAKAMRDIPALLEEIAERPDESRWLHYLGNSYCNLGEGLDGSHELWGKAIDAYFACANLSRWHEEKAMALYLAARVLVIKKKDYQGAIEACMHGLAAHAGMAELPWLAADAARMAGNYEQAVYLAALAEVHGERSPYEAVRGRLLHVSRDATRDGPAKILAEVFRKTGATEREAVERKKIEGWGSNEIRRSSG